MRRNRFIYALLVILVIIAGLFSRSTQAAFLPEFVTTYAGDTLWALMVFLLVALLFRDQPTWKVAIFALTFSFAIEASQLYQAEWINTIRSTTIGALVLGSGFLWSDLACYTTGIFLGVTGEITSSAFRARSSSRQ